MLTIRKARRSDVKTLVSLWKDFTKHHDGFAQRSKALAPHLKRRRDAPKSFARWAKKHIGSKDGVIFLAEIDGRAVGYSLAFIKRNPMIWRIDTFGYISDLFVTAKFRGQGASSKLVDEVMKWFRRKGIRHISLHVLDENHVAKFIYRKWGFFPIFVEMRKDV